MSEQKTKNGLELKVGDLITAVNDQDSNVAELQEEFERKFKTNAVAAATDWTHLNGLQEHYKHKSGWSTFLMLCMGGMIVFQSILLFLVGLDWLDFTKYKWLLPALMVQNLGQIVGLWSSSWIL